jgi:hypothetical protein
VDAKEGEAAIRYAGASRLRGFELLAQIEKTGFETGITNFADLAQYAQEGIEAVGSIAHALVCAPSLMEDPFAGSAQASVSETGVSRAMAAAAASLCKSCRRVIMEPAERKNEKEHALGILQNRNRRMCGLGSAG